MWEGVFIWQGPLPMGRQGLAVPCLSHTSLYLQRTVYDRGTLIVQLLHHVPQQHVDFAGSASTKLKSSPPGRWKPVLMPSHPSSILYSPVWMREYTSCVTALKASSTFAPVFADVSTWCKPLCSANSRASSLVTSRRPLLDDTRSNLQPTNANTGRCGSMWRRASIIHSGICSKLERFVMSYTSSAPTELR